MNLLRKLPAKTCTRHLFKVAINYPKCNLKDFSTLVISSDILTLQKVCSVQNDKKFSQVHKTCWNCNSSAINNSFCESCSAIQPLKKNLNHFEVLGLEKTFQVNKADLVKLYRSLQNIFHPDKFSLKSESEQSLAAEYSTAVNKAYNTLSNPVSRAEYMLLEAGHPISEGEISIGTDFLMEIMDINIRLSEAEDKETVKAISDKNQVIMDNLIRETERCFAANDIAGAKIIVAKLKYYYNIYEKVKEYETKHGIYY